MAGIYLEIPSVLVSPLVLGLRKEGKSPEARLEVSGPRSFPIVRQDALSPHAQQQKKIHVAQ